MERLTENKIVLIIRETRIEELKARFNTVSQARFYVRRLGGDFADYEAEDAAYHTAVTHARQTLARLGRVQIVQRAFLPNFIFGPDDIVVAIGQDGLVANTLKYLDGQPLVGVNPDPARYDGQLLPFTTKDIGKIVPEVFQHARPLKTVTMARATLTNGQTLHAVNDLFIGPRSHGSARYAIRHGNQAERHSSSGIIVSTGLGSTGWLASLIAGATGIVAALGSPPLGRPTTNSNFAIKAKRKIPWDTDHLYFTVREPFPSKTTAATLVFGQVTIDAPLYLESLMAENGVIFSDGIETDYLEFNSGMKATIELAARKGRLVM